MRKIKKPIDGGKTWIGEPEGVHTAHTPKLELVERLRFRAWLQNETAGERQVRHLTEREEAAAAIAKLTAERDAAVANLEVRDHESDFLKRRGDKAIKRAEAAEKKASELESGVLDLHLELTAAEKRVKELEAELKETYEERKEFGDWQKEAARASRAETANKLLSERVAVLETALEQSDLTTQHRKVLQALYDITMPDGEYCIPFKRIADYTGLDIDVIKPIIRNLADKGHAKFYRGLTNDEGQFAGSGYCITKAGREALR